MTYGMAEQWGGWDVWHGDALYGETPTHPTSVSSSVAAYRAAGVPAARLGIGIGFYGDCWVGGATTPGQPAGTSHVGASDNVMTYEHILADYYSAAAYHWDDTAKMPYLSFASPQGPEQCTFVSYEDPDSIAAKGAYVASEQLGGTIIWAINEGYVAGSTPHDPLMAAVRAAFLP
jgi:chitinase